MPESVVPSQASHAGKPDAVIAGAGVPDAVGAYEYGLPAWTAVTAADVKLGAVPYPMRSV